MFLFVFFFGGTLFSGAMGLGSVDAGHEGTLEELARKAYRN